MNSSRSDRLLEKALQVANTGAFSLKCSLYSSEIKRFRKQWCANITMLSGIPSENGTYLCIISWDSIFYAKGLNFQQSLYATKLQDDLPETANFAERLFLISARHSK